MRNVNNHLDYSKQISIVPIKPLPNYPTLLVDSVYGSIFVCKTVLVGRHSEARHVQALAASQAYCLHQVQTRYFGTVKNGLFFVVYTVIGLQLRQANSVFARKYGCFASALLWAVSHKTTEILSDFSSIALWCDGHYYHDLIASFLHRALPPQAICNSYASLFRGEKASSKPKSISSHFLSTEGPVKRVLSSLLGRRCAVFEIKLHFKHLTEINGATAHGHNEFAEVLWRVI